MQRNWLKVFLLYVICAVSLHGNCSAERWVQYTFNKVGSIHFVDDDYVHTREYNGRKYLETRIRTDVKDNNRYKPWLIELLLIDVENLRSVILEQWGQGYDKHHFVGDISAITSSSSSYIPYKDEITKDDPLLQWIEQNRPDVINEILAYNAGGTASAGAQAVTANGNYGFIQTFGNGPVEYVPRMIHGGTRYYVAGVPANGFLTIQDRICPPTAPDSHKPLYIIYDVDTYPSFSQNTVRAIFSYDNVTNTFTVYDRYYDFSRPVRKIRIIDQNTVEGSYWDGETYSENNPLTIQFKYVKTLPDHSPDRDGYTWTGWDLENDEPAPIDVYFDLDKYVDPFYMNLSYELVYAKDNNEVGLDGLFAFLARKGNVGYAPPAGSRVKYY